jgi:hypothetical protein
VISGSLIAKAPIEASVLYFLALAATSRLERARSSA